MKRFKQIGNKVLFKSRVAMAREDKHYNKWYEIATIPADLRAVPGLWEAVARAFVLRGHVPFKSEDEVRTEALSYAVAG